jgi:lipopolysaccharide/colanic/teichoic acid biosynthesis glycosyltransferase
MSFYTCFGKRIFDVVLSFVGIVVLFPLFLVGGILVKVGSPGPVFFFQDRIGLKGKIFRVIKFRSMYCDNVKGRKHFEPGAYNRITKTGSFLRKTKIDELPQLFNVLKGDMSLVGPRPEVEKYADFYTGRHAEILQVRPGITDASSIKYRDEEKLLKEQSDAEKFYREVVLPDKLEINLKYVESGRAFGRDLKVIFETISAILRIK